jgi:hypothetical protein
MRVDAGNARTIIRLLSQMTSARFDVREAMRAFLIAADRPFAVEPWSRQESEGSFFLGVESELLRRWLAALPEELRGSIVSFFAAPPHRFVLVPDPFAGAAKLGVQDAALELSYFLPARFVLDPEPARAAATGRELLRHLRIGTLYHELLGIAREGADVAAILELLAGETGELASAVKGGRARCT